MNTRALPAHTYTHKHFPGEHLPSRNRAVQSARSAAQSHTSLPVRHCCFVLLFFFFFCTIWIFIIQGFHLLNHYKIQPKHNPTTLQSSPLCCRVGLESEVSIQSAQVGSIKWIEHLVSWDLEKWAMPNQGVNSKELLVKSKGCLFHTLLLINDLSCGASLKCKHISG